jgi:hypothetical protein
VPPVRDSNSVLMLKMARSPVRDCLAQQNAGAGDYSLRPDRTFPRESRTLAIEGFYRL